MKLNINGREVIITVKGEDRKNTQVLTDAFICQMSSAFYAEGDLMQRLGCNHSATASNRIARALYDVLEAKGYYKDL